MQRLMRTLGVLVALCIVPSCVRYQPAPRDQKGSESSTDSAADTKKDSTSPPKKPEPSPLPELPSLQVDRFQTLADGLLSSKAEDVNKDGCVVGLTTFGEPKVTTIFFWDTARGYKSFLPQTDDRYEVATDVPPSINDSHLVAFTARRKEGRMLQAFLWDAAQQNVYQVPSPLPLDFPETEVWDIDNDILVGAIRHGKDVKGCTWKLTPHGPIPTLLPEPDHVIARCVSPNGKHIARWKHREEDQPIAIADDGSIVRKSDVPGVNLFAQNFDGVKVGETREQGCVIRGEPHLLSALKGKKGCVTAINDFGRIVGWYQPDDPGSHSIAFTAVLPAEKKK